MPLLVTHSGKFHCDEVFAYVTLRLALGEHRLLRTRDPAVIASGDVVFDVGLIHNPETARFDHHQRGAPTRPDGTPFSAAGLVWQVHGPAACTTVLTDQTLAPAIAAELDDTVIRRIDEVDNGFAPGRDKTGAPARDTLGLASLVGDCNPTWDSPDTDAAADAAFLTAATLVEAVLRRRIESLRAKHAADALVLAAHAASADPRILELSRGMPWKAAVFAHALPVLFAVYPVSNGNWMVDTMPPEPGSFAQRLPLPEAWAGLQSEALAEACGVPDAVFVHLRRFVAAARSRTGAVAMASKAIEARPEALPLDSAGA